MARTPEVRTPVIQEGGIGRAMDGVYKLRTGNTDWVPEEEVRVKELYVVENGEYFAENESAYAYFRVCVNIPGGIPDMPDMPALPAIPNMPETPDIPTPPAPFDPTSPIIPTNPIIPEYPWDMDPIPAIPFGTSVTGYEDGEHVTYTVDEEGNLHKDRVPSGIKVVRQPKKREYKNGEEIDYSGILVMLTDSDGNMMPTYRYPSGLVPFNELVFPVKTFGHREQILCTSDMETLFPQPIPAAEHLEFNRSRGDAHAYIAHYWDRTSGNIYGEVKHYGHVTVECKNGALAVPLNSYYSSEDSTSQSLKFISFCVFFPSIENAEADPSFTMTGEVKTSCDSEVTDNLNISIRYVNIPYSPSIASGPSLIIDSAEGEHWVYPPRIIAGGNYHYTRPYVHFNCIAGGNSVRLNTWNLQAYKEANKNIRFVETYDQRQHDEGVFFSKMPRHVNWPNRTSLGDFVCLFVQYSMETISNKEKLGVPYTDAWDCNVDYVDFMPTNKNYDDYMPCLFRSSDEYQYQASGELSDYRKFKNAGETVLFGEHTITENYIVAWRSPYDGKVLQDKVDLVETKDFTGGGGGGFGGGGGGGGF